MNNVLCNSQTTERLIKSQLAMETTIDTLDKLKEAILDFKTVLNSSRINTESEDNYTNHFKSLVNLYKDTLEIALNVVDLNTVDDLYKHIDSNKEFISSIFTPLSKVALNVKARRLESAFVNNSIYKVFDLFDVLYDANIDIKFKDCMEMNVVTKREL